MYNRIGISGVVRGIGWTNLSAQMEQAARERGNAIAVQQLREWLLRTEAPDFVIEAFNRLCAEARRGERCRI